MRPTELKKRIKAYQHAQQIDSFGQALDAIAALIPRHRSRIYRYLNGEDAVDGLVADRIRQITPEPSK